MSFQAGNEVWDILILRRTLYSSVHHLHAHRASSLLHLPMTVAVVMECALAQLEAVCVPLKLCLILLVVI